MGTEIVRAGAQMTADDHPTQSQSGENAGGSNTPTGGVGEPPENFLDRTHPGIRVHRHGLSGDDQDKEPNQIWHYEKPPEAPPVINEVVVYGSELWNRPPKISAVKSKKSAENSQAKTNFSDSGAFPRFDMPIDTGSQLSEATSVTAHGEPAAMSQDEVTDNEQQKEYEIGLKPLPETVDRTPGRAPFQWELDLTSEVSASPDESPTAGEGRKAEAIEPEKEQPHSEEQARKIARDRVLSYLGPGRDLPPALSGESRVESNQESARPPGSQVGKKVPTPPPPILITEDDQKKARFYAELAKAALQSAEPKMPPPQVFKTPEQLRADTSKPSDSVEFEWPPIAKPSAADSEPQLTPVTRRISPKDEEPKEEKQEEAKQTEEGESTEVLAEVLEEEQQEEKEESKPAKSETGFARIGLKPPTSRAQLEPQTTQSPDSISKSSAPPDAAAKQELPPEPIAKLLSEPVSKPFEPSPKPPEAELAPPPVGPPPQLVAPLPVAPPPQPVIPPPQPVSPPPQSVSPPPQPVSPPPQPVSPPPQPASPPQPVSPPPQPVSPPPQSVSPPPQSVSPPPQPVSPPPQSVSPPPQSVSPPPQPVSPPPQPVSPPAPVSQLPAPAPEPAPPQIHLPTRVEPTPLGSDWKAPPEWGVKHAGPKFDIGRQAQQPQQPPSAGPQQGDWASFATDWPDSGIPEMPFQKSVPDRPIGAIIPDKPFGSQASSPPSGSSSQSPKSDQAPQPVASKPEFSKPQPSQPKAEKSLPPVPGFKAPRSVIEPTPPPAKAPEVEQTPLITAPVAKGDVPVSSAHQKFKSLPPTDDDAIVSPDPDAPVPSISSPFAQVPASSEPQIEPIPVNRKAPPSLPLPVSAVDSSLPTLPTQSSPQAQDQSAKPSDDKEVRELTDSGVHRSRHATSDFQSLPTSRDSSPMPNQRPGVVTPTPPPGLPAASNQMPVEEWTWIITNAKDPAMLAATGSDVQAIAEAEVEPSNSSDDSNAGAVLPIDPHIQDVPSASPPSSLASSGGRPTIAGPNLPSLASSGEFRAAPPTAAISYSGGHKSAKSDAEPPAAKASDTSFSSGKEFRDEMRARLKTGELPLNPEATTEPEPSVDPEPAQSTPKGGPKGEDKFFISGKRYEGGQSEPNKASTSTEEIRKAAIRNTGSIAKPKVAKKNAPWVTPIITIVLLGAAYLLLVVIGNKFLPENAADSDLPPLPNDQTFDPLNPITDRWDKYFHAGEQSREQGDLSEAIKYYSAAIKQNPRKLPAYHARGLVYLSLKNYAKAKTDFTSALAIDSKNVQVLNDRAAVEYFLEHYPQAIDDYNAALSIDPRNAVALSGRALNKYKWGRFNDAILDLKVLLEDHPDYERAYQQRADIHFALGSYARALDDYTQALKMAGEAEGKFHDRAVLYKNRGATYLRLKRMREAYDDYSMAIRLDPNGWDYYSGRGFVCMEVARPFQAVQDLKAAIELNPYDDQLKETMRIACEKMVQSSKHVLSKNPKDTKAGGEQAYAYVYMGSYGEAEKSAKKVLSSKPKDVLANLVLGECNYARKSFKVSLDAFNEALSVEPDNIEVLFAHAKTLRALERYDDALNDYNLVIAKNAKSSVAFNNRAVAYMGLKQYENALKDLQESVRLCPQNAEAEANIGRSFAAMSKWDKSIEALSLAIGLAPKQVSMLVERGEVYNQLGDSESALADFDRALEIRPDEPEINKLRATTLRKLGRYEAALSAVDSAMRLAPADFSIVAERGRIRFMLKRTNEAIEDMSKAIEHDPKNITLLADRALYYLVNRTFENSLKDSDKASAMAGWRHRDAWQIAMTKWCTYKALKNNSDADRALSEALSNCPQNTWTYSILEYAQGKITDDKLLSNHELTGDTPGTARAWIAAVDAIRGNKSDAQSQLDWLEKRSTSPVVRLVNFLLQSD